MRILAALLLCTSLQAANWIVLRTPGLELYTDASEKTARAALDRLANVRRLLPESGAEPVPVRVMLYNSGNEFRALAPTPKSGGFYQSGPERDFIMMPANTQLSRNVVHEYVHFALSTRGKRRPGWIEEGLAEFYSNAQISGSSARLGSPIPEHLDVLARRTWYTPAELEVAKDDPLFYAQSWALVHMFWHQPTFPEHITAEHLDDLRRYLRNVRADVVPAPPSISAPKVELERVPPMEALLIRADAALRAQHPEIARPLYEQAAREFPNSSAVAAGLGAMALALGDEPTARGHLERALQLNDRDAAAWFELGLLNHDDASLERAAALNPNLGEAHLLLGVHATDDRDLARAMPHLEQAVRLMPRKSYAWYSLAFAQARANQPAAARESLQQALHTAATQEQRAMAQTLLGSLLQ